MIPVIRSLNITAISLFLCNIVFVGVYTNHTGTGTASRVMGTTSPIICNINMYVSRAEEADFARRQILCSLHYYYYVVDIPGGGCTVLELCIKSGSLNYIELCHRNIEICVRLISAFLKYNV